MPDDTPDLTDRIAAVAQGPAQASDAAGAMQQHNPKDLIEVDKYLAQKRAAKRRLGGLSANAANSPGVRRSSATAPGTRSSTAPISGG